MCAGFWTSFLLRPDSRFACLPLLATTVHVFIVVVFAWYEELRGHRLQHDSHVAIHRLGQL